MNKEEFLEELDYKLRGLPEEDYQRAMSYYRERISDVNYPKDADVTRLLGTPDEAARAVLNKTYNKPVKIPKEKSKTPFTGCLLSAIAILAVAFIGGRILIRHFNVHLPWNIPFLSAPDMKTGNVTLDEFREISLEADTADVELIFKGSEYRLEYKVEDNDPSYSVESGVLKLTQKNKSRINILTGSADNRISIYVPENAKLGDVSLKSDTGSVKMSDGVCEKLIIEVDTGAAKCIHNDCGEFRLISDTGSCTVEESSAKTGFIKVDTGSVKLTASKVDDLKIESDTGSIKLDKTDFSVLTASADTGSVTLEGLSGKADDYLMDLKTDTGSVHVNGDSKDKSYSQNGVTEKGMKIKTDTGSIKVNFE